MLKITLLIPAILAICLIACGDEGSVAKVAGSGEAKAVVVAAFEKNMGSATYHASINQTVMSGSLIVETEQEIDFVLPRHAYATVRGTTGNFAMALDGAQAFVNIGGGWQTLQQASGVSLESLGFSDKAFESELAYARILSQAVFLEDAVQAGIPVRRVRGVLDAKGLVEQLVSILDKDSPLAQVYRSAKDMRGTAEYSVSKSDGHLVGATVEISFSVQGQKASSRATSTFSRFNQPVTFPADSPVKAPSR